MPYDTSPFSGSGVIFTRVDTVVALKQFSRDMEYMQKPHSKDHSLAVWQLKVMAEGDSNNSSCLPSASEAQ